MYNQRLPFVEALRLFCNLLGQIKWEFLPNKVVLSMISKNLQSSANHISLYCFTHQTPYVNTSFLIISHILCLHLRKVLPFLLACKACESLTSLQAAGESSWLPAHGWGQQTAIINTNDN